MKHNGHRKITELLGLLVFGLFALCVASVLLMGSKTYQVLTQRANEASSHRVAVRYLATRFHQAPEVVLEDFCGLQTLTIREEIHGKVYLTRVYCYEGTVRELFSGEKAQVTPADGEIVLEAEKLTFIQTGSLLTAEITYPDGNSQQVLLALPEWKEGHHEE